MSFTATFKFRTSRGLVKRADRVRRLRHKSQSEIGREMLLAYVEAKEGELGLVPPAPANNCTEQCTEVSRVEQKAEAGLKSEVQSPKLFLPEAGR